MKKFLLTTALFLAAGAAHAGVITGAGNLVNEQTAWYSFSTSAYGTVTFSVTDTVADGSDFDSVIFLLRDDGSLGTDDQLGYNDDSGSSLNSFLSLDLDAGNYFAVVATHGAGFDGSAVIGGHHRGTDYTLAINGEYVEASVDVPEPATVGLLGLGVAGLAAARRRQQG